MTQKSGKAEQFEALLDGDEIDLLALEEQQNVKPKTVVLPNRRRVTVNFFDGVHYQLWEALSRESNPKKKDEMALKLLRFAIPSITAAEIVSLSPFQAWMIGRCAARQADETLEQLRKNVVRPEPPPRALAGKSQPPRSTQKTKRSTSSRASRGNSGTQAGSGA